LFGLIIADWHKGAVVPTVSVPVSLFPDSVPIWRASVDACLQGLASLRFATYLIALLGCGVGHVAHAQDGLLLETTRGQVFIRLRADLAPQAVGRIVTLTREGFYNNAPFHRVIPRFMAQTGDGERGNGTGKSSYPNLPSEFSNVPFRRGVVGMARAQDPNSGNSQFFIMLGDTPSLNGLYTVVGEVVSGMDVIDQLRSGEPVVANPDRIVRAQIAGDARPSVPLGGDACRRYPNLC
jgi:peptidylprolyl isomerase